MADAVIEGKSIFNKTTEVASEKDAIEEKIAGEEKEEVPE